MRLINRRKTFSLVLGFGLFFYLVINPSSLARIQTVPCLASANSRVTAKNTDNNDELLQSKIIPRLEDLAWSNGLDKKAKKIHKKFGKIIARNSPTPRVRSRVTAVILLESLGDPGKISKDGAQGLMGLMPDTARSLGVKNPFDPEKNIRAGTRYFLYLEKKFGPYAPLAYNLGPNRTAFLLRTGRLDLENSAYLRRFYLALQAVRNTNT